MRSTPSQEFDSIQVVIHYLHEDLRSNRSDAKHGDVQPEPPQHPEEENPNDVNGTPREQATVSPFILLFYVILIILLIYFVVFLLFSLSSNLKPLRSVFGLKMIPGGNHHTDREMQCPFSSARSR